MQPIHQQIKDITPVILASLPYKKAQKVAPIQVMTWETAQNNMIGGIVRDEVTLELIPVLQAVTEKMVFTIEGAEIRPENTTEVRVCVGTLGEIWLQKLVKIQRNYDLVSENNGVSIYEPKPDSYVDFAVIDADVIGDAAAWSVPCSWGENGRLTAPKGDVLISRGPDDVYPHIKETFFANYKVVE